MGKTAEQLLSEAMMLDEGERAELAAWLMETLGPDQDSGYLAAWEKEIQSRIEELDSGKVKCIPWEQARKMIGRGRDDEARWCL